MLRQVVADLKGGNHRGLVALGDRHRISPMIRMPVGESDVGRLEVVRVLRGKGVVGEKGVDDEGVLAALQEKGGVP